MWAWAVVEPAATACGGFFCDQNDPVVQAAERVVFGVGEDGSISMSVRIAYAGPSESFAWVVPVHGVPELSTPSDALFDVLGARLQPTFTLAVERRGCADVPSVDGDADVDTDTDTDAGGGTADTGAAGVEILATGAVGPYETVVLQSESATALVTWLTDHGYDLPPHLDDALAPYVGEGQNLLALRLRKDQDTGDLTPIGLRYRADEAAVPIRLTALAAQPGMPLEVYVFGRSRAVPGSYLHLVPHPYSYDWWNGAVSWPQLVGRAADEAGGHGFATDVSTDTAGLVGTFYWGQYEEALDELRRAPDALTWWRALLGSGLPADERLLAVLRVWIPVPDGVDETAFYNSLDAYPAELPDPFDAAGATAALDAALVEPLRQAEVLVGAHPHVTRLTSSLDAAEMTVDPSFVLNADLEQEVAQGRVAREVQWCDGADSWDARREVTFEGLPPVRVPPYRWLYDHGMTTHEWLLLAEGAANLRVERTGPSGQPEVLVEHLPPLIPASVPTPRSCGCEGTPGAGAASVALLALAAVRRRR